MRGNERRSLPFARPSGSAQPPLRRELRGTALAGAAVVGLLFLGGGGWAATAPLAGAVIASGVVSPESSLQVVQHLEGGIIREIRVKAGDRVESGESLVVLDEIGAGVDVAALANELRVLAAREARLTAEREAAAAIDFSHPALADAGDPEVDSVIRQERSQFEARRANDESRKAILVQRVVQLAEAVTGIDRQLEGVRRQRELIAEERATVEDLLAKGYERKPRLLALQRDEADLLGKDGELMARIAQSREAAAEIRLQIANLKVERLEQVDEELTAVQAQRFEVEKKIQEASDRFRRRTVRAPVDGTVNRLHFRTLGGVVRPAEPILDLVPSGDELVIEARVSPQDIDAVRPGLEAYVIFPSYPQRDLKRIAASVARVSPDAQTDARTGASYFLTEVRVGRSRLAELAPQIALMPGLPAEVYIATGERTLLEYLVQPFLQAVERSFRDG